MSAAKWRLTLAASLGVTFAAPGVAWSEEAELETTVVEVELQSDDQAASASEGQADAAEAEVVHPTHKQTLIIDVNADDLAKSTLHSFCLNGEGQVLAACGEHPYAPKRSIWDPTETSISPATENLFA
jgi:hypothetical protein